MQNKPDAGIRLGAMLLDHFAMTFIAAFFSVPGIIYNVFGAISSGVQASHEQDSLNLFGNSIYLMLIGFAVYFCKDSFNGRSIAKRVLKLQVVEHTTDEPASPLRCFVRNILIVIWPIEVLVMLANPERRLGDRLAGTRVVRFDPTGQTAPKPKYGQIGISLVMAYALILVMALPYLLLMPIANGNRVQFIENSLNETAAMELESLIADSLDNASSVDVMVYDQIRGHENLKYVSVIVITENAMYAAYDSDQREEITESLVIASFPEGTFVGRVQYLNKNDGSRFLFTRFFDWRE